MAHLSPKEQSEKNKKQKKEFVRKQLALRDAEESLGVDYDGDGRIGPYTVNQYEEITGRDVDNDGDVNDIKIEKPIRRHDDYER